MDCEGGAVKSETQPGKTDVEITDKLVEELTGTTIKDNHEDQLTSTNITEQLIEKDDTKQLISTGSTEQLISTEKLVEQLSHKFPNMNRDEPEKREWMSDLPQRELVLNDSAGYSARFGFEGEILDPKAKVDVNSGLYHHGEEADRAGYTLSELFTLLRSSSARQRVLALNTISAIMDKYWTGMYDNCFGVNLLEELVQCGAISILRSCLDEKEESLICSATECLANIIAPQGEEAALDVTSVYSLENPVLAPTLDPEVAEEEMELKDHELAQVDLIAGLLRMDILPRLRYILTVLKPDPGVVLASLRILIRMARHSAQTCQHILNCPGLMHLVTSQFLPAFIPQEYSKTSLYGLPVHLACKLCRIIASWHVKYAQAMVTELKLERSLMVYLTIDPSEASIPPRESVLLCIEAFRTWTVLLRYNLTLQTYSSIYPILMRLLLYFVNNVDVTGGDTGKSEFDDDVGAWLITVLSTVLGSPDLGLAELSGLYAPVETCARKWLVQLSRLPEPLTNQSSYNLLASAITFLSIYINKLKSFDESKVDAWKQSNGAGLKEAVTSFAKSAIAKKLFSKVYDQSVYLSSVEKEHRSVNGLPITGAVLNSGAVHPVLAPSSPMHLLTQILRLNATCINIDFELLPADIILQGVDDKYLQKLSAQKLSAISNWFSRHESRFLFWLVMCCRNDGTKTQIHSVALRLCGLLQKPDDILVKELMEQVIFAPKFLRAENLLAHFMGRINVDDVLPLVSATNLNPSSTNNHHSVVNVVEKSVKNIDSIKDMYLTKLLNETHCRFSLAFHNASNDQLKRQTFSGESVLAQDWQYFPLLETYNLEQSGKLKDTSQHLDAMVNCLSWLLISNATSSNTCGNRTAEFYRLATVFLAGNDIFLNGDIHILLVALLNEICREGPPDLAAIVPGITSGHDFYIQLLEQFQAVSYGDQLFAMFICIPLGMSQPEGFRKSLWLERQELLKSITLKKENFGPHVLESFMSPCESELELLVAYYQAIMHGYLRKQVQTFLYDFAVHHLKHFLKEATTDPEKLKFQKFVKENVKGELACDLEL
eukprot:TRINITY_DN7984_c0_g1_i4.p1 TRINITY_DN7984_c0_g1~~TRINITY_DN7984_c0_g1_i4.p1  ORF type:complete len:1077 (+),score=252.19 TRINITY_DN7984_c0_g1_i4:61-3231(+)